MQKILDSIVHLVVNTSGMLNNVTSEMRRSCHYPTCHRCNALSNIRSAGIESGIGHSVEKNPMNSAFMELCTRKSRHTGPSASEPIRLLWNYVPEKFITLDLLHLNLFVLGQCEHFRACHRCNTLPKYRISRYRKRHGTLCGKEPHELGSYGTTYQINSSHWTFCI